MRFLLDNNRVLEYYITESIFILIIMSCFYFGDKNNNNGKKILTIIVSIFFSIMKILSVLLISFLFQDDFMNPVDSLTQGLYSYKFKFKELIVINKTFNVFDPESVKMIQTELPSLYFTFESNKIVNGSKAICKIYNTTMESLSTMRISEIYEYNIGKYIMSPIKDDCKPTMTLGYNAILNTNRVIILILLLPVFYIFALIIFELCKSLIQLTKYVYSKYKNRRYRPLANTELIELLYGEFNIIKDDLLTIDDDNECKICLEELQVNEQIKRFPCEKQWYCVSCFDKSVNNLSLNETKLYCPYKCCYVNIKDNSVNI